MRRLASLAYRRRGRMVLAWIVLLGAVVALAPALAGQAFAGPWLGIPFLVAGGLKIVYDLSLWFVFRRVHPPEERLPDASAPSPVRRTG